MLHDLNQGDTRVEKDHNKSCNGSHYLQRPSGQHEQEQSTQEAVTVSHKEGSLQSKKDGKDQETIQSSTTPDPGYHRGK